jgi:hypothetical protein
MDNAYQHILIAEYFSSHTDEVCEKARSLDEFYHAKNRL